METVDAVAKLPVGGPTADVPTNPPAIKSIKVFAVTPSDNPYAAMMNFPTPTTVPSTMPDASGATSTAP
jgi:hypothetical protein